MAYNSPNYTEAEIERRREQAKKNQQLVDPVTGKRKFGGPQPGAGRPKKRRVTEVLNEKIEGDAQLIYDELKGVLTGSDSEGNKLKAIQIMLDTANQEIKYQQQEKKNLEELSDEDLIRLIEDGVSTLSENGELSFDFTAEAEEIPEDQQELEQGAGGPI